MIERMDLFRALAARRTTEIVVMTMTATLQWPLVSRHELDFDFLAFGMGHAGDFGLGLALARPERKVIVLKGDGGLLMSLGSLVTWAACAPGLKDPSTAIYLPFRVMRPGVIPRKPARFLRTESIAAVSSMAHPCLRAAA